MSPPPVIPLYSPGIYNSDSLIIWSSPCVLNFEYALLAICFFERVRFTLLKSIDLHLKLTDFIRCHMQSTFGTAPKNVFGADGPFGALQKIHLAGGEASAVILAEIFGGFGVAEQVHRAGAVGTQQAGKIGIGDKGVLACGLRMQGRVAIMREIAAR